MSFLQIARCRRYCTYKLHGIQYQIERRNWIQMFEIEVIVLAEKGRKKETKN